MKEAGIQPPREPGAMTFALLRLLADGEFHSGETLARQVGISRASVNNALQGLEHYGLELYSVRGRGYCLSRPLQWLDAAHISGYLGARAKQFRIEILDSAVSSNSLLLQQAKFDAAPCGSVLAVEWQSGGRGRLGRAWHSGLGGALTFSLLWRFDRGLSALSGLSLAAGVALIRALRKLGIEGAQLKWPNDVLHGKDKLAGILIETQGDMLGPSAVVIGIGLNLNLPQAVKSRIGQPAGSLEAMAGVMPDRNRLFAAILLELEDVLQAFSRDGFPAVREEWQRSHAFQGKPVRLMLPGGDQVLGIVRGVSEDGSLQLETQQGMRLFNVGEVSLRETGHAAA